MADDPRSALRTAIWRLERDYPDHAVEWLAEEAVKFVRGPDRRSVLVGYISDEIAAIRRAAVRREEQRAYREATRGDRVWRKQWTQEKERVRVEDPSEYRRRYPTLGQAVDDFRAAVRLELTTELLASTFALGDGRKVTWGRATVADHPQRIAVLLPGAIGTLRTVALHEEAIAQIEASGQACLSDVKTQAA